MKSENARTFRIKSTASQISILLLLLFSCARPRLPAISDQTQFIEKIRARNPKITTLKAQGSVVVDTKEKTYRFKVGILMSDNNLFIETYGFGVPQGYVSLANNKLTVVIPSQHEIYKGTAHSSLKQILTIDVTPQELFAPMLRRLQPSSQSKVDIDDKKKKYVLTETQEIFWVDSHLEIRDIQGHSSIQKIEYGALQGVENQFPDRIKMYAGDQSIEIRFESVTLNQEIPQALFQIDVPTSNFHVYSLEN